jgi:site-specific DNA recombinase
MREEVLAVRLGQIVKDIFIPGSVLAQLENSLLKDKGSQEATQNEQRSRLRERINRVRNRLDQAYVDKLDGRIDDDLWARKSDEWHSEEQRLCAEIMSLEEVKPEKLLDGVRILELAHKAHFLYLKQTPEEQAKLLKMVVSNCSIDATTLYPTYRKPFDLIFTTGKNEGWCARRDSNSRPSGSKAWAGTPKSPLCCRIRALSPTSNVPMFQAPKGESQHEQ